MEKSLFFNDIGGDRLYTAEDFNSYFGELFTNGVTRSLEDNCKVIPSGTSLQTTVTLGKALIKGCLYILDANKNMTHSVANITNDRIDRVVIRYDLTARAVYLAIVLGTPAASPIAPALTRNSTVYEISLAQIRIIKANTSILLAQITDERADTSVCGRTDFMYNLAGVDLYRPVIGSYTGDGAASKLIVLGFTPSAVQVISNDGRMSYYISGSFIGNGGLAVTGSPCQKNAYYPMISVEPTGFKVYETDVQGIYMNMSGGVFNYIAYR